MRTTRPAPLFWYARTLLTIVVRNRYFAVAVCALALLFAAVALYPLQTGADEYSRDYLQAELDALGGDLYFVDASSVPQSVTDSLQEERLLLEAALSAPDGAAYCAAVADYEGWVAQNFARGGTVSVSGGIDVATLLESRAALLRGVAASSEPAYYETSADMPLAYWLPFALGSVPYVFLFVPCLVAALACRRAAAPGRLLAAAPVGRVGAFAATAAVVFAVSVASLVAACAPGALVSLVRNGFGDPSYPVVYVSSGQIVESCAGAALGGFLLLWAALALFVSLVLAACATAGWGAACALLFAAVMAAPLASGALAAALPGAVLAWLPTTYLNAAAVAGYPDYLCGLDVAPVAGCSLRGALAAVLLWCAAAAAAVAAGFAAAGALARRRAPAAPDRPGPGLEARDLAVSRRGGKTVCAGASFALRPGEALGLVAPNGRGKTSLMRAVAGLAGFGLRAEGLLAADGTSPADGPAAYRRLVCYMPEGGGSLQPSLTVRETVEAAARLWDSGADPEEAARACGAGGFLGTRCSKLSQGMAQQAAFAAARATGARYLLLDEPSNGLDQGNAEAFWAEVGRLRGEGRGVLVSSHVLGALEEACPSVLFLHEGQLIEVDTSEGEPGRCAEMYEKLYEDGRESHSVRDD